MAGPVLIFPGKLNNLTATIAQTATLSDAVKIEQFNKFGLYVPAIDEASIEFKVAEAEEGTYDYVYSDNKTTKAVTINASEGGFYVDATILEPLFPYSWIKVEVGAAQNTAAVEFIFIGKVL